MGLFFSALPEGTAPRAFSFRYELAGLQVPTGIADLYFGGVSCGAIYGEDGVSAGFGVAAEGFHLDRLGVTLVERPSGALLQRTRDLWVDVDGWTFTPGVASSSFSGALVIPASLMAQLSLKGLYTGMPVRLAFSGGRVEFSLYGPDGAVKFSGRGRP